ncbi:uncharacterized protein Tco025E_09243, partial [Trypanosoma conorhini]
MEAQHRLGPCNIAWRGRTEAEKNNNNNSPIIEPTVVALVLVASSLHEEPRRPPGEGTESPKIKHGGDTGAGEQICGQQPGAMEPVAGLAAQNYCGRREYLPGGASHSPITSGEGC